MTRPASFRASQAFNRASWVQPTTPPGSSFITRSDCGEYGHPHACGNAGCLPTWGVREAIRSTAAPQAAEPVAWYRIEDGRKVFYETQAWPDLTPLVPPQAAEPQQDSLACYHRALVFMVGQLDDAATILENAGRPFAAQAARGAITLAWHYASGRQT